LVDYRSDPGNAAYPGQKNKNNHRRRCFGPIPANPSERPMQRSQRNCNQRSPCKHEEKRFCDPKAGKENGAYCQERYGSLGPKAQGLIFFRGHLHRPVTASPSGPL
jgi:hypothetical protein